MLAHALLKRDLVSSATAQAAYSLLTLHPCVTQFQIQKELLYKSNFTLLFIAICIQASPGTIRRVLPYTLLTLNIIILIINYLVKKVIKREV